MIIPWYYKYGAIALLSIACFWYGWTFGTSHVQSKWDVQNARNEEQAKKIQEVQKLKSEQANNETKSLLDRNNAYWRMRANAMQANSTSTSPGRVDEPTKADSFNPDRAIKCNPEEGAADAIIILQWQKFYRELSEAEVR